MRGWCPSGLGDEDALFAESLDGLSATRLDPFVEKVEREDRLPEELVSTLVDNELILLNAPVEQGGSGADLATSMLAAQRVGASVPAAGLLLADAHAAAIARASDVELSAANTGLAPAPACGPAAADGVRFRAELFPTTEQLLLVGDGEVRLVAVDAPGLVLGPTLPRTGLRGADLRLVALTDSGAGVAIGSAASATAVRSAQVLGRAAVLIGVAQAALGEARTYLGERRQFGRTLSEFAALRALVAQREAEVSGAVEQLYSVARQRDVLAAAGAAAVRRAQIAVARAAVACVADAVQLHGGYGYTTDYPVERLFRDALSLRASLGGARPVAAMAMGSS